MKLRILVALFAAGTLIAACEKKEEGGDKGGDSSAGTGTKECDEYFKAVEACAGKMPEEGKAAFKQGMEQMKKQLAEAKDDASKQAVATGCKQAADALKNNPACK
jgi:hypothetical protein